MTSEPRGSPKSVAESPDGPMSDPKSTNRTFARDEVESILLEAARLDDERGAGRSREALTRVASDGLSRQEIERAAADVGISRSAVTAASLRVALRSAHQTAERFHLVHELPGELSAEELERLVAGIRTIVAPASVTRTSDRIEVQLGKQEGESGSLLVQIRSHRGVTSVSVWSTAPVMSTGDVASGALLGVPAFLFPVVAVAGGQWPALGTAIGLAAAGASAATGVALAVKRHRIARWRARLEELVTLIASQVSALTTEHVD